MDNKDTRIGRDYHEGTKHPYGALFDPHHVFNPRVSPSLTKTYAGGDWIELSVDRSSKGMPTLQAIAASEVKESLEQVPDLATLARVLYYSSGVTKRLRLPGRDTPIPFRAAACTGALYHIEMYLVCGDLEGLAAGVYYFDPERLGLQRLRSGDYRGALVEAGGGIDDLVHAPAVLVFSDVFWRNAYKYQAREYRHAFWDCGTILANTLAIAAVHDLPSRLLLSFVDEQVDGLLGLQAEPEMALALMTLGRTSKPTEQAAPQLGPPEGLPEPVVDFKTRYPAIERMHAASTLNDASSVRRWREGKVSAKQPAPAGSVFELDLDATVNLADNDLETTIQRRGSTRRFVRAPITFRRLSYVIHSATSGQLPDYSDLASATLNDLYLIVSAVEGLPPGAYRFLRQRGALELLKQGEFRSEARSLGFNQDLAGDASVNIFFLADLEQVFSSYGNRGYRAAQLEASLMAGRMYLAAYSLGFGATGLTFYDDAIASFFSPQAEEKSAMFLIALGVQAKQR